MSCPDDNILVAMVEQQLDPARFAEVEVHIDSCEHCRKIVAAAITGKTLAVGTPQPDEADAFAGLIDVSCEGRASIWRARRSSFYGTARWWTMASRAPRWATRSKASPGSPICSPRGGAA